MGQESSEVRRHIDETREELGGNIHELQDKVRSRFDWRAQFEDHCGAVLGAAFGVGFLLSRIGGAGRAQDMMTRLKRNFDTGMDEHTFKSRVSASEEALPKPRSEHREKLSQFVNSVEGALIGVASTKVRDFLNELVPGFAEHYQESQRNRRSSSYQESQRMPVTHVASSGSVGEAYRSPAD